MTKKKDKKQKKIFHLKFKKNVMYQIPGCVMFVMI